MPEYTNELKRKHPAKVLRTIREPKRRQSSASGYVELRCKSNFSFLRGASHPEELVEQAEELGYSALAITDRNTLSGIVRAHIAAKTRDIKLIIGAEITPQDAPPIALYPTNRAAYGRLCRLLTKGNLRAKKGECELYFSDIAALSDGLIGLVLSTSVRIDDDQLYPYRDVFGDRLYLSASHLHGSGDTQYVAMMREQSSRVGIPLVATNDVHYHVAERRFLQDVLTCIREKCTLAQAGTRLFSNAERYLKSPESIARLFPDDPNAIARTVEIAHRCRFSLDELQYHYPEEICPDDRTPYAHLLHLVEQGAKKRYPDGTPEKVERLIAHEMQLIEELHFEPYFLTVYDLVRYARSRGILCQGRGSAANSAVCYCLGITSVDPDRVELLFERFISKERNEPPDIDVDFEHERREEVLQYVFDKYGRDRAGIVAEVITYRPRSAVRDVGKALGLSLDRINLISKSLEWWAAESVPDTHLKDAGIDPKERTIRALSKLVRQLLGFPRHLSQHVGGFVITQTPLCEMVPIGNAAMPDRTFIEWDKDDIDALGMLKVDCLALGMLTAIRKCFDLVHAYQNDEPKWTLASVPAEDPAVYDMLCDADSIGVFQVESRAQMTMLPRLKPRCYYELVIEVAIVRPGPIQGKMVHPYLRRRNNEESPEYATPEVKAVLERTLGIPIFQEQVMALAVAAAGFTPGEADQLRRSMGVWRKVGVIERFREKLFTGMQAHGLSQDFAERLCDQIRGFGEYGFPESHAASFALLVYVSAWLKRYHPAAFCAAVINSLPMGFYAPAQLVRDAIQHGVTVVPIDVNHSRYDCTLEGIDALAFSQSSAEVPPAEWGKGGPLLRLGMRLIKGVSLTEATQIEQARQEAPFGSIIDLHCRARASRATLAKLAAADAFGSLGLNRREALWQVLALETRTEAPTLFDDLMDCEPNPQLPKQSLTDRVAQDYSTVGLTLAAHPLSLLRSRLRKRGMIDAKQLKTTPAKRKVRIAGLVITRQRPATAKGTLFFTLEDEYGQINLIVRQRVYERFRRAARDAVVLVAEGMVERQGKVIHVMVQRLGNVSDSIRSLTVRSRDFR